MSGVKKIVDIVIEALNTCIDKLEVKKNICGARSKGETLKRLTDNIIGDVDYMSPLKDLVNTPFPNTFIWFLIFRLMKNIHGTNCGTLSVFRKRLFQRRWRPHGFNWRRL